MEETQINEYLRKGLKNYLFLKKLGKIFPMANKVADQVLSNTSFWADLYLEISGTRKGYKKFSCNRCGRIITDEDHQGFVKQFGYCLHCDHIFSDNPYPEA